MGLVSFRVAQRNSISLSEASAQKYVQKRFFKLFPCIFGIKLNEIVCRYVRSKNLFRKHKYSPKTSNIDYFWTFKPNMNHPLTTF